MDQYYYLNRKFKKSLYFSPDKEIRKKFIGLLVFIFVLFGISVFSLSSFSSKQLTASIPIHSDQGGINSSLPLSSNNDSENEEKLPPLLKDKTKKTNILLIGIPGEPWPAPYLTDSIEVISIDEDRKEISAVAIPRDLLVKIPGTHYETRINSLFAMEQDPALLQKKVKEITGLETQYYIIIDLGLIEKIIDILDGIDVEVKEDIYDPKFPTVSRGYETFSISAGSQHLNGKMAIKYIRSRHQARGDFGRIERQQQVMEAIKEKTISLNLLSDLPKIFAIFEEVKAKTNIGFGEIKTMASLAKWVPEKNIHYLLLDAGRQDSLLIHGKTILGKNAASVLWPKAGKFDYSEIKEEIRKLGD